MIFFRVLVISLTVCFLFPLSAAAQDWKYFKSETGIVEGRMPENLKENFVGLRVSPEAVARNGQVVSTFDHREYGKGVKNYIIRYDQTLGAPLTPDDVTGLIARELSVFSDYYSTLDGVLRSREDTVDQHGVPGGEIHIAYKDPNLGEQSIRIRVMFTPTSRIQHIVSGAENIMNSFQTQDFYDSLLVRNGYDREIGDIRDEWNTVTSPLDIFTVFIPNVEKPFFPNAHTVKNSDGIERVSMQFFDPIFQEFIYYNIYGYRAPGDLGPVSGEKILRDKHILRHRFDGDSIPVEHFTNDDLGGINSSYLIKPSAEFPLVNAVKLRAEYSGNAMIVHEVMGSERFTQSEFMDYIVSSVDFHPEGTAAE